MSRSIIFGSYFMETIMVIGRGSFFEALYIVESGLTNPVGITD